MRTMEAYAAAVEAALPVQLRSLGYIPEQLLEAMSYSLEAGGKRLRPALLLSACEAMGGDIDTAMPFACALEMIHTYSLIHDDLPAMDNDDLRRGRPTNHKVFGEGMAILAGDGLLHGAMELMLRAACVMDDLRGVRAAEAIARRSGVTGMVAGQVMDVTGEGSEPTEEKVTYIHAHKTADLITAPIEAGMILAGADADTVARGVQYGYHLGMAFQMVDDLLDVVGDTAVLGKQTGMDAQAGKLTWVALRGVDGARADAAAYIAAAEDAAEVFASHKKFFKDLAQSTLGRVK
ncbi:MAG: polyprenyl synthetase family protein [Clostridia bacterium]|nr:polyprenyl synthetase family protein [Clostridia bacterium]